ncbi:MAG: biopolymer transporter ExbD [Opitutales bacterium]
MSHKRNAVLFPDQGLAIDMSPMIDLVFLLLIFFMTSSRLITNLQDPNVEIPIAYESKVSKNIEGRYTINLYADGTLHTGEGRAQISLEEFEKRIALVSQSRPDTKLLLRADRAVRHESVREVIQASVRGGVSNIVFATFLTE